MVLGRFEEIVVTHNKRVDKGRKRKWAEGKNRRRVVPASEVGKGPCWYISASSLGLLNLENSGLRGNSGASEKG